MESLKTKLSHSMRSTSKFVNTVVLLLGFAMLGMAAGQSAWAQQQDGAGAATDWRAAEMQMRIATMRRQMAEIHAAADPQERRRLLDAHMRQMHEAMGMMSRETMPAMKRRLHTHKHTPVRETQTDAEAMQSAEHMQKMEQMMGLMEGLLEQMSQHQEMLTERED